MRLPPDAISESTVMRMVQRLRRIEMREAGGNVIDLIKEREKKVVREEIELMDDDPMEPQEQEKEP